LLPELLDDCVGEDNPVRAIDVFVDELDLLGLGFSDVMPEASRLNWRASTGYRTNFLVDVTGSQTRHTSSRGNVGAAEDLKREKGK
jgi:hypothetical protein